MTFLSPDSTPVRKYLNLAFLIPYLTQSTAGSVGKLLFSGFKNCSALPWGGNIDANKENQKKNRI